MDNEPKRNKLRLLVSKLTSITMRRIGIFILVLIIQSCTNVRFESPQPINGKTLKKIPNKFIGDYKFQNDTLSVTRNYVKIPIIDLDNQVVELMTDNRKIHLSDSIVLKYKNQKYYLNIKSDNSSWSTYILKLNRSNNLIVESTDSYKIKLIDGDIDVYQDNDREKNITRLLDSLKFNKIDVLWSTKYIISPNKAEFNELIEKGLFWEYLRIDRMK